MARTLMRRLRQSLQPPRDLVCGRRVVVVAAASSAIGEESRWERVDEGASKRDTKSREAAAAEASYIVFRNPYFVFLPAWLVLTCRWKCRFAFSMTTQEPWAFFRIPPTYPGLLALLTACLDNDHSTGVYRQRLGATDTRKTKPPSRYSLIPTRKKCLMQPPKLQAPHSTSNSTDIPLLSPPLSSA